MGGGTNDTAIMMGILFFLLGVVSVMPMLIEGLRITDTPTVSYNNPTQAYGVNQNDINSTKITADTTWQTWNLLSIIIAVVIWFPAPFPLWFNLVFIVLRVAIMWLIVRLFRSGGG